MRTKISGCKIRIINCERRIINYKNSLKNVLSPRGEEVFRQSLIMEEEKLKALKIELFNLENNTNQP